MLSRTRRAAPPGFVEPCLPSPTDLRPAAPRSARWYLAIALSCSSHLLWIAPCIKYAKSQHDSRLTHTSKSQTAHSLVAAPDAIKSVAQNPRPMASRAPPRNTGRNPLRPNSGRPRRLLRARRERPRRRRAAEQRDELAALHHSITSSASC